MMEKENKSLIEDLKIAIIYGKEAVDGENKDGIVEKIYKDEDDTAHYFYMKEFLENHFVQEKVLNEKHDVNSIFYEMQKMGHIVFAENTSTEKYKTGIFYIPKSISDKQKESLKIMQEQLEKEDYNIKVKRFRHKYTKESFEQLLTECGFNVFKPYIITEKERAKTWYDIVVVKD